MAKTLTAAERMEQARELVDQARKLPRPQEKGWGDFSYTAQVKDILRQARDLIKFIPYSAGASGNTKREATDLMTAIDRAENDILHDQD